MQGMRADYRLVDRLSTTLCERMRTAASLRVETPFGTSLTATFDPALHWVKTSGIISTRYWSNLPAGEVFTTPASVDGVFVCNGTAGDYFGPKYGDLAPTPLTLEITRRPAGRRRTAIARTLEQEFWDYCHTDEHSDRVGELAFGTNLALRDMIGILLQDEKVPGVHLAFGDPYGSQTGADWKSTHAHRRPHARLQRLDRRRAGDSRRDGTCSRARALSSRSIVTEDRIRVIPSLGPRSLDLDHTLFMYSHIWCRQYGQSWPPMRAPVVEMMRDAAARENPRQPVGLGRVLPRPGAGRQMDVAAGQVMERPAVGQVGGVVDGVVEVEVVVVVAEHEALHVVDAREREAALDHVGMLQQRVRRMIAAERRPHRPHPDAVIAGSGCARTASPRARYIDRYWACIQLRWRGCARSLPNESLLLVLTQKTLTRPASIGPGDRVDHALALVLPFVAAGRRKGDHGRAVVAEDDDAHLASEAV